MLYFALVFAVGWVLGLMRVFWLEPHVGVTTAVLLEQPFMLLAIIFSARWVVRQLIVPRTTVLRLGMGVVAISLLLIRGPGDGLGLRLPGLLSNG